MVERGKGKWGGEGEGIAIGCRNSLLAKCSIPKWSMNKDSQERREGLRSKGKERVTKREGGRGGMGKHT